MKTQYLSAISRIRYTDSGNILEYRRNGRWIPVPVAPARTLPKGVMIIGSSK